MQTLNSCSKWALAAVVPRILWRPLAQVERRSLSVCLRCEPGGAVTFNEWIFFCKVDSTLLCALSPHWSNTKPTQVSRLNAAEPPRHSRLSSQDSAALHLQTTQLTSKTLTSVQLQFLGCQQSYFYALASWLRSKVSEKQTLENLPLSHTGEHVSIKWELWWLIVQQWQGASESVSLSYQSLEVSVHVMSAAHSVIQCHEKWL